MVTQTIDRRVRVTLFAQAISECLCCVQFLKCTYQVEDSLVDFVADPCWVACRSLSQQTLRLASSVSTNVVQGMRKVEAIVGIVAHAPFDEIKQCLAILIFFGRTEEGLVMILEGLEFIIPFFFESPSMQ